MATIRFELAKFTIRIMLSFESLAGVISQLFGAHGTGKENMSLPLFARYCALYLNSDFFPTSSRKNKRQVALKLQKSAPHYTEAAMDEIEFLDKVSSIFIIV